MVKIRKDTSGETYEYRFINLGKEVLLGDGLRKEEIFSFIKDILDSLTEKNELRIFIEIDDEEESRSIMYYKNASESMFDEIRPGTGFPGPQHQTEGWG